MKKLLLIEDSIDCYQIIKNIFNSDFSVTWVKNKKDALKELNKDLFDAIILDLILPDGEGMDLISFLKESQNHKSIPVLILSSKTNLSDKIYGFSMGADDYICKPFEPIELKFRVLARIKERLKEKTELNFDDITVQLLSNEVYLDKNDHREKIELTSNEFKILRCLIKQPGDTFTREQILNKVWGNDVYLYPRIVDTYISRLRKKLHQSNIRIISKSRKGYSLLSSVA